MNLEEQLQGRFAQYRTYRSRTRNFRASSTKQRLPTLTDEELADMVLDVGINWEHFVASNDNLLIPEHPLKITEVLMQEKIDALDIITEAFVREVNLRSVEKKTGRKT